MSLSCKLFYIPYKGGWFQFYLLIYFLVLVLLTYFPISFTDGNIKKDGRIDQQDMEISEYFRKSMLSEDMTISEGQDSRKVTSMH